jgi:hypothetical protein
VRARPDSWHAPFLLGFLQSYYLGETSAAAQNIALAARAPGAPAYLGLLATRLAADAGQLSVAEQMATAMLEQAQDDESRAEWQRRLLDVRMERDLRAIGAALTRYRASHGSFAPPIEELVRAGYLPRLPVEPHGGSYFIDPRTGEPGSTAGQRLRVRGRHGATAGVEVVN